MQSVNVVDRENDTHTWLTNKLGTSNDSWTGSSICSQLNAEVLRNTKECFPMLANQVKIKLLLSLFHIPKRNIEEWRVELEEIIELAAVDSDLWISMIAEIIKTFPSTGSLNTDFSDLDEHRPLFGELINDLKKTMKKKNDPAMQPLECHYLNKAALTSVVGNQPAPTKHFTLKRKPKCQALKMELTQKSVDAINHLKKNAAPTVPVRSRGMPRKMTDTTPLKGIPSRLPSSGFRNSSINASPMTNRTPMANRIRKDGGIKLLDINEQPMGYAQAKRRKRQQELEEQQKKAEEAKSAAAAASAASSQAAVPTTEVVSTTPEYAQGLTPITAPATPIQAAVTTTTAAAVASVLPQPYSAQITTVPVVTPSIQNPVAPAAANVIIVTAPSVITPVETPPKPVQAVRPQPTLITQTIRNVTNTNQQTSTASTRKGLSLTREQMLEAQEMFRTANKVTRPEKALILGFMAGSRDNPCPKLGNIVTVMLSENVEEVTQPDGTTVLMQVETHFQMNYTNGEWKRIKKNRRIVNEETVTGIVTNQVEAK